MREAIRGRAGRERGESGAPVVRGALVISASLLKAGGGAENAVVVGITFQGLAQPLLGLGFVTGREGGGDSSLEV